MYIHVTVQAGSKKEAVTPQKDSYFVIAVKEKAERNMANARVREIVAGMYGVKLSSVRIINGHTSPKKLIDIAV